MTDLEHEAMRFYERNMPDREYILDSTVRSCFKDMADFADAKTQQLESRIAELEAALEAYRHFCSDCGHLLSSHNVTEDGQCVECTCAEVAPTAREALNKQHSPGEE